MVTHQTFKNNKDEWIEPNEVERIGSRYIDKKNNDVKVGKIEKMSKSKKMLLIQMILLKNMVLIQLGGLCYQTVLLKETLNGLKQE